MMITSEYFSSETPPQNHLGVFVRKYMTKTIQIKINYANLHPIQKQTLLH